MFFMRILFCIITLLVALPAAHAQTHNPQSFDLWLEALREDARSEDISDATLDAALDGIEPIDRVIELDRKQPESVLTLAQYLEKIISTSRIENGQENFAAYQAMLEEISEKYGVQPQYIVALWGIETNYGSNTGNFNVVHALATLAYDGRRSDYFRGELLKSLKIIDDGHIEVFDMVGSWAGAMGQCQFMPSSFFNFAEDYNDDGKRDIWNTQEDVFASIANYLSSSGWKGDEGVAVPVMLPEDFDMALADIKDEKSIEAWQRMGVRTATGDDLPELPDTGSVILVGQGPDARPYLIYNNYKVLLKWNRSRYFATAVGILADHLKQEDL